VLLHGRKSLGLAESSMHVVKESEPIRTLNSKFLIMLSVKDRSHNF
jgi:hypothetical protein